MSEPTPEYRIPDTVTRGDLLAALEPLLGLLGVTANEVHGGVYIGADELHLSVVARDATDDGDYPAGIHLADAPSKFGELCHHVTVRVVE